MCRCNSQLHWNTQDSPTHSLITHVAEFEPKSRSVFAEPLSFSRFTINPTQENDAEQRSSLEERDDNVK